MRDILSGSYKEKVSCFRKKSSGQRDYEKYIWTGRELAEAILQAVGVTLFLAVFFYRSMLAVIPLSVVGVLYFRKITRKKRNQAKKDLTEQFKECILAVSASLQAGYAVENAFLQSRQDMALLYGEGAYICEELDYIRRGLAINIPLEELLLDFAERSGCGEIREFSQIFVLAKRNGGNMTEIIRGSASMIGQKIELRQEIAVLLSGKQLEQTIMKGMPFAILLYISITNQGYFDVLYHNAAGAAVMTGCLAVYLAAYVWGESILKNIEEQML